jgi:hypothetical protein
MPLRFPKMAEAIMFHNEDIVEEIATRRQGKMDSIGTSVTVGVETQNQWVVRFHDGKEPIIKYFMAQEDLRLIRCPHEEPTEPRFVPTRSIMG